MCRQGKGGRVMVPAVLTLRTRWLLVSGDLVVAGGVDSHPPQPALVPRQDQSPSDSSGMAASSKHSTRSRQPTETAVPTDSASPNLPSAERRLITTGKEPLDKKHGNPPSARVVWWRRGGAYGRGAGRGSPRWRRNSNCIVVVGEGSCNRWEGIGRRRRRILASSSLPSSPAPLKKKSGRRNASSVVCARCLTPACDS